MQRLFIYLFSLLTVLSCAGVSANQTLDSIAAVVNEDIITRAELKQRIEEFKRQLRARGTSIPSDDIMHKQVLERMIVDSIQLQMAKAQGIRVDDLTLNRMLENIAGNNKLTLDELRRSLEADDLSYQAFREQTREDMTIRQLQQRMVYNRIRVSDQEIEQFLEQQAEEDNKEQYHVGHILIATPEAATPEDISKALDRAQKVIAHLQDGEAFNSVAQQFSDGQQALNGGDLGWRTPAELPSLFLDTVQTMQPGEFSTPLRSAGGFHVLKLIDKKSQKHIVKQTHARHILIRPDQITSEQQVIDKLKSIRQQLVNGADFATLAEEYSQDPGSKNNGGDLGWQSPGSFVQRFEQVMDSLNIGEISEPFRSQFGWHIVQVLERRKEDETEQVKKQEAEKAIKNRKAEEELQLWLRRIRDEAYVEYRTDQPG
jgi:peptidyl-prolyl cis-trans isomerase SurA